MMNKLTMTTKPLILKNLDQVINQLHELSDATENEAHRGWSISEHLAHCQQVIEFSMNGYPTQNPWLLQNSLGKTVYHLFRLRGYMQHDINAYTPGAGPAPQMTLNDSILQLTQTIKKFDAWTHPLKPHYFYGRLSKSQYNLIHSIHFANHWDTIVMQKKMRASAK